MSLNAAVLDTITTPRYIYQSFDDVDFQQFLSGSGGFGLHCNPTGASSICGNFNKPRMALGKPKRRQLSPTPVALWHRDCEIVSGSGDSGVCAENAQCEYRLTAVPLGLLRLRISLCDKCTCNDCYLPYVSGY